MAHNSLPNPLWVYLFHLGPQARVCWRPVILHPKQFLAISQLRLFSPEEIAEIRSTTLRDVLVAVTNVDPDTSAAQCLYLAEWWVAWESTRNGGREGAEVVCVGSLGAVSGARYQAVPSVLVWEACIRVPP